MNKILEIGDDYVIVQPGAVKASTDKELARRDKFIPPDPASSNCYKLLVVCFLTIQVVHMD